jgi:CHAT domain
MAADRHEKTGMLSNLAAMLGERFGRIGAIRDLDEAVDTARKAVAITPSNHPNRPMYLSNLGAVLSSRFERVGKAVDLDEKIDVGRAAVRSSRKHPNWPLYLANLSQGLRARYILRGDPADLTEAILVLRDSIAATPQGNPDLPGLRSALAGALHSQFELSGSDADLTEAIMLGRMAVSATPRDDRRRAIYLSGLAGALWSQSAQTGLAADLDDAIAGIENAVAVTPENHPDLGLLLSNLGQALRTRFDQRGDPADLNRAVSIGHRAVAVTPDDHPDRATRLFVHANSLRARFVLAGDDTDLNEAVAELRQASQTPDAAAEIRIRSANAWGRTAAESGGDWILAAEGFAAAVRLMPLLAWRGLDRPEQQNQLAMCAGVPEDAAACAIASGQLNTAIELLEQGRSILWGQALQTRSELSTLRDMHPRLADRLEHLRAELEDAAISDRPQLNPADDPTSRAADRHQRDRRMRAAREWDETLAEVRRQYGFAGFLLPEPYDVLKPAAAGGPVVVLNVSRYRCDALAITSSGVKLIPLPDLTHQDVIKHAGRYIAAHLYMSAPRAPAKNRSEGRQMIMAVLEWLWDAAAQPVLEELGNTGAEQAGKPLPRVWWCPTGPLSMLPLHAAGYHDQDDKATSASDAHLARSVLDRLVSSYTPTLAALVRARERPPPPQRQQRLLIAAVPAAQGYRPLPGAAAEAQLVASRACCPYTLLGGKDASRQAVLRALTTHAYAHFACHGGLDISDPGSSGICLSDGLLAVSDIAHLRFEHAELAFLAACQTASVTGPWADEAIHLAAALQIVGYRHVIATLWSIGDQTAPDIADKLYAGLCRDQAMDTQDTAVALHSAIQLLRTRFPADPTMWAHYVHFGP